MRLFFILIAVSSVFAQQDTTIRLDVQQVLVPVVVTDKKGHHVAGLHASDFRVFEDGVQQEIASFSTDTAGSVDAVAALAQSEHPLSSPRHTFVICVDTLHTAPASSARVREALENLFEKEKTTDAQYVLIGIGRQLQMIQTATTNPMAILVKLRSAAFRNALAGSDGSALSSQLQSIRTRMDDFCKRCTCGSRQSRGNCDSEIDALKQSVDAEAERWTAPFNALTEQFRNVVAELGKLPTRRTLILISDGFNIQPKRDFYAVVSTYLPDRPQFKLSDDEKNDLRDVLKLATDRNITIDTIDSRGSAPASLNGGGLMDASASGSRGGYSVIGTNNRPVAPSTRSAAEPSAARNDSESSPSMEHLARETGGVYSRDSKEMLQQFRSALADGREYYMLAYVPLNKATDGKFRAITVEARDKKLNIRAKTGYWAPQ